MTEHEKIRLKHDAWVVVADGEKALFLRNAGDAMHPNLQVMRELQEENPPTREQGTDRPGRFHDGPSPHRSSVADTDWHRLEKERFATRISELLYSSAQRGDFDHLVLVAPPLVLGEMRQKLHQTVTEKIAAEFPKTLTNHPVWEIEKLLTA